MSNNFDEAAAKDVCDAWADLCRRTRDEGWWQVSELLKKACRWQYTKDQENIDIGFEQAMEEIQRCYKDIKDLKDKLFLTECRESMLEDAFTMHVLRLNKLCVALEFYEQKPTQMGIQYDNDAGHTAKAALEEDRKLANLIEEEQDP